MRFSLSHTHAHGWLIGRKRRWNEGDVDLEKERQRRDATHTQNLPCLDDKGGVI